MAPPDPEGGHGLGIRYVRNNGFGRETGRDAGERLRWRLEGNAQQLVGSALFPFPLSLDLLLFATVKCEVLFGRYLSIVPRALSSSRCFLQLVALPLHAAPCRQTSGEAPRERNPSAPLVARTS